MRICLYPHGSSWALYSCAYVLGQTRVEINILGVFHRWVSPCHWPSPPTPTPAACLHHISLISRQLREAVVLGDMQGHSQGVSLEPITQRKPATCDSHRTAAVADESWGPGLRPAASQSYLKKPLTICSTRSSSLPVANKDLPFGLAQETDANRGDRGALRDTAGLIVQICPREGDLSSWWKCSFHSFLLRSCRPGAEACSRGCCCSAAWLLPR